MNINILKTLLCRFLFCFCLFSISLMILNGHEKESWYLLYKDIELGFIDNKEYLDKLILIFAIFILCVMWAFLGVIGKFRANWKVKVCKCHNHKFLENENRHLVYFALFFCCIFLLYFFISIFSDFNKAERNDLWGGATTIGHSFGEIDGDTYTGSLEAFLENYQKGQRVFEVDFSLTSDEKMVLCHDWDMKIQMGVSSVNIPTQEEFLSIPILNKYTPLSLEDLYDLMKEYPDIWIVTDTKDLSPETIEKQFTIIRNTALDMNMPEMLDRLVVQLYAEEMYQVVKNVYPFKSYIFTMYQRWYGDIDDFKYICRWCADNGINKIAMGPSFVTEEIVCIAQRYDLEVYVIGENEIENAKSFLESGISGIYTDEIEPSDLEE